MTFQNKLRGYAGLLLGILLLTLPVSCKKYLDVKSTKRLVIPGKLSDLQSLLDFSGTMNELFPALLEIPSDDYYVTTTDLDAAWIIERQNYVWDKDATYLQAYQYPYQVINVANVVLDELKTDAFRGLDQATADDIKGQALFFQGLCIF